MSFNCTQPEYYGWYPDVVTPKSVVKNAWDEIHQNNGIIDFARGKTYIVDAGADTDIDGLFTITKRGYVVNGNGAIIQFNFFSIAEFSSQPLPDYVLKLNFPTSNYKANCTIKNITFTLSAESNAMILSDNTKFHGLSCAYITGQDNVFSNVKMLHFPLCVYETLSLEPDGSRYMGTIYRNCTFIYGGGGHDNAFYIQGYNTFTNCNFIVEKLYSSHAIYWGMDRNYVKITRCNFLNIGGTIPKSEYVQGYQKRGNVVSWRGTTGSGTDCRGLVFTNNYMENCGRTLMGYHEGTYLNPHYECEVYNNTWSDCEEVYFHDQYGGVFQRNNLIATGLELQGGESSLISKNKNIGFVVFGDLSDCIFENNTCNDAGCWNRLSDVHGNTVNLTIKNNSFVSNYFPDGSINFEFYPKGTLTSRAWQFNNNTNLKIESNRFENVIDTLRLARLAIYNSIDGISIDENVFINTEVLARTENLTWGGSCLLTDNTFINNSENFNSNTLILQNTATGSLTARGNTIANATYTGTLNNA